MATAPTQAVRRISGSTPAIVPDPIRPTWPVPRWAAFLLVAGLYLTLRGYHAFDGDQAYRLPILLRQQDPTLYESDPFVRAFDAFNPHRGYLALLGAASRPLGLAAGLAGLFAATLAATAVGVDRLARAVWPERGTWVGLVAFVLVLAAKAGNIGTNHLFEATLLDRLVGFALGWLALASAVGDPRGGAWASAGFLGVATLVHPSVGLQLALTLAAAWMAWGFLPGRSGVGWRLAIGAILGLGLAVVPALAGMAGQGGRLLLGLPAEEFRFWAVMVQGPQHMLPSTWRASQWLAWGCYPALGVLALLGGGADGTRPPWPAARVRLAVLMGVNLASLGLAYLAVEVVGDLRITVFQPFRMATLARGLALVALSGRVVRLWSGGELAGPMRAAGLVVGLAGDWMLVVATAVDLGMMAGERLAGRGWIAARAPAWMGLGLLGGGLAFLARHDTESGHVPLLAAVGSVAAWTWLSRRRRPVWSPRRLRLAVAGSWALPAAALLVAIAPGDLASHGWAEGLVARWRFGETPTDDLERLAVWCREQTPSSARFIGPPGPKTFRLWSRRSLAFNRGGSPYHAEGLADWSSRYRDHVGFRGSTAEFARAYLADRHALEAGYQAMTDADRAALARRQGATHVLAAAPSREARSDPSGPLELLRVEGRYAAYRVRAVGPESGREPFPGKNSKATLPIGDRTTKTASRGASEPPTNHEQTAPVGPSTQSGRKAWTTHLGGGSPAGTY